MNRNMANKQRTTFERIYMSHPIYSIIIKFINMGIFNNVWKNKKEERR